MREDFALLRDGYWVDRGNPTVGVRGVYILYLGACPACSPTLPTSAEYNAWKEPHFFRHGVSLSVSLMELQGCMGALRCGRRWKAKSLRRRQWEQNSASGMENSTGAARVLCPDLHVLGMPEEGFPADCMA